MDIPGLQRGAHVLEETKRSCRAIEIWRSDKMKLTFSYISDFVLSSRLAVVHDSRKLQHRPLIKPARTFVVTILEADGCPLVEVLGPRLDTAARARRFVHAEIPLGVRGLTAQEVDL
jgi:hypothetical protein